MVATKVQLDAEVLEPGAEVQRWLVVLATEFGAIRESFSLTQESSRVARVLGSLRRLRTAARIQLAADNREASTRRGGSELAEDVVLYAGLHELAAEVADGREDSARHGGCGTSVAWPEAPAQNTTSCGGGGQLRCVVRW